MEEIYFDNAATTICYEEVSKEVSKYFLEEYANPSAVHKKGFEAGKILKETKDNLLKLLGIDGKRRVIFTSGASESVNLAVKGNLAKYKNLEDVNIITTNIEHPCVTNTFRYFESLNVTTKYITVNEFGVVNIDELINNIDEHTKLVSIIYVNNEFGVVQDIENIIKKIKEKNENVLVHIDATQAVGKVDLHLKEADMISLSAHKFHGPKGVGALVLKENITLTPLIHGGGQQESFRSGTVNTPLIAGFNEAIKITNKNYKENKNIYKELFEYAVKKLNDNIKDFQINTPYEKADISYHILNVSFKGIKGEVLLHMLEEYNIYVSVSSACSARNSSVNTILQAIGVEDELIKGTIRISFSEFNTKEEIDYFIEKLKECINRLNLLNKYK
ncbi:cysteine desulfurase family protein [uncultured Anaerofustis sp.]|uniref:cysteine desulfurase family protein n=1 Tax=uncultured Anaerofustis sp. TaxID=904996 RepID=UPI0025D12423|nr:cysteine desulfurase family protein [uncultured Anaerofustis sp.]